MKEHNIHEDEKNKLRRELASLETQMSFKQDKKTTIEASIRFHEIAKKIWEWNLKEFHHDKWIEEEKKQKDEK